MGLTENYLITTKNLQAVLNAIQGAQAPDRFTQKFLSDLDFKSTNDRLHIKLFKELGFLDETGVPTQRYYNFLDQSESGRILAQAITEAYSDLFALKTDANELSLEEVKNKFKTLTQGKKSDKVISHMANTFIELCSIADWSSLDSHDNTEEEFSSSEEIETIREISPEKILKTSSKTSLNMRYNIEIHLPTSRDPAVYDAIFESIKKHLT